jgi:hypothetical protein
MLVYNGNTNDPFSGATYWERPGCDSYLLNTINALQLIISPVRYDSSNDILECNILATFLGSYNGTLAYEFGDPTPTYGILTYIPLKPGDINPNDNEYVNSSLSTSERFGIKYDSINNTYSIYGRDPNAITNPFTLPLRVPTFDGTNPLDASTNYYELIGSSTLNIILYDKNGVDPTIDPASAFIDSNLIPFNPYFILNGDGKYEQQPIVIEESGGLYPNINLASIVETQQSTCSLGIQTCNMFCNY